MYSQIIPNHIQEELVQIGEDITRHTFRVGDIVVAVTDYVEANNIDCTKRDVWRAVGAFIGKAAATVRDYETLADFYPVPVRQKYHILSASHFRMAMRIDAQTDYSWKTALDYAVDRVDDYGRPATVDELMKVFIYNSEPFEFDDDPLGGNESDPMQDFVKHLTALRRVAELMPVPEPIRQELCRAFDKIESILVVA